MAQTRLSKAAMNSEVLHESHFLEPYGNINIPTVSSISDTREDETTREIMQNGGIEGNAALQSTGNGNSAVHMHSSQMYSKMSHLLILRCYS